MEVAVTEAVTTIETAKIRRPWVAGVLSILLPGLGHLYVGRPALGACWFASFLLVILACALAGRSPVLHPAFNAGWFLLILPTYLFVSRSAIRLARSLKSRYKLTTWNRWYVYAGVFIVGTTIYSFLSDAIHDFVIKAYKIPSGAMIPTLLVGDHIYVDKLGYRLGTVPKRGDVIVFPFPEDETKDFVKRIVGVPGDTIEIRNKRVILNGVEADDIRYTQRIDPSVIQASVNPRDNFGPVTVPERSYFVLGDNRDQSLDSRFWGYVDASKIKGKVTVVYWSWEGSRIWSGRVRWERIGNTIQ